MNMGLSAQCASSVPLVLNPDSGAITPRFHVVSDALPDFHSTEWSRLFGDSAYQYPLDDDDLTDVIDLTASPTPSNEDRVEPSIPFHSTPSLVAPPP
jgi:hypothetical protein